MATTPLRSRNPTDHGASLLEYAAVATLAAAVAVILFASGLGATIADGFTSAVCTTLDREDCGDQPGDTPGQAGQAGAPGPGQQEAAGPNGVPGGPQILTAHQPGTGVLAFTPVSATVDDCEIEGPGTDHGRREAGRDSAIYDDRDTSRRNDPYPESGSCGPPPHSDTGPGLGAPVPGESVEIPQPPHWQPVDEGAGEWGSSAGGWNGSYNVARQRLVRAAADAAAHAVAGRWPNASRNLLHYLGNSGEPLEQDVDQIFEDVPEFRQEVDGLHNGLAALAVRQAKADKIDGPVTFPVNTAWDGFYITSGMSEDWFRALGGIQYNVTGQITVYPPDEPGGEYRYTMETQTNLRDQYNWDEGKSTQIGPFTVDDDTMGKMHRAGVAQEYLAHGRSETETREGTLQ